MNNQNENNGDNIIDINNNFQEQIMPDINDLILEQKNFVDDDYILNLHQKLAQTRELRKLTENSIKILNARINCLESENQRTLSKINITSKKTNNKLLNMEQKRNHSQEKMEHLKKLEKDLKKLRLKNQNFKLERDLGIINSRKNVISHNKMKGQISKKEREEINNIKKLEELNEHSMKKNNVDAMRSESLANYRIKKIMEIQKKEMMIKDLEDKINFELERKRELEKNINKMLQEENETLTKINKTEEMQKKLFQDFQKALNEGNNYYNNLNLFNDENCNDNKINNNEMVENNDIS